MKNIILETLHETTKIKARFINDHMERIQHGADRLATCIASGHKIMLFGNGGSAADAQHIAAELVNRFQIERPPLAALALTTDTSVITSIGNDYHFDNIFSKQVKALGTTGDIAIGISTSGNSQNVIKAIDAAKDIGMFSIGLTGKGGRLAECVDMIFAVKTDITARIQEAHIMLGHIWCDLVDRILFPEKF